MYNDSPAFDHLPGRERTKQDAKLRLGKKLNISNVNQHLKEQLRLKGMSRLNLIKEWAHIVSGVYAHHSIPLAVKNINGKKTLFCKVLYTRILEIQHEKENFIKKINLYAGRHFIDDIVFKRTDKLPITMYKPLPSLKKIINTPHPKLKDQETSYKNQDLYKTLNQLAHFILPIENKPDKAVETADNTRNTPKLLKNWRERAKNLLNCPDN